jgi:hypothetical protein
VKVNRWVIMVDGSNEKSERVGRRLTYTKYFRFHSFSSILIPSREVVIRCTTIQISHAKLDIKHGIHV